MARDDCVSCIYIEKMPKASSGKRTMAIPDIAVKLLQLSRATRGMSLRLALFIARTTIQQRRTVESEVVRSS